MSDNKQNPFDEQAQTTEQSNEDKGLDLKWWHYIAVAFVIYIIIGTI